MASKPVARSRDPKGAARPDAERTQPASDQCHPLHHEPGLPARGTVDDRDLPRGRGKPIGQPDDFGRI